MTPNDKPSHRYHSEQAVEDGILMSNPRQNKFSECNLLTANLWQKLNELCARRNQTRIFPLTTEELCGSLMAMGRAIYHGEDGMKFEGDNDRDFFATPKNEEGVVVWLGITDCAEAAAKLKRVLCQVVAEVFTHFRSHLVETEALVRCLPLPPDLRL